MQQAVGAWIKGEADLETNASYTSFEEFVDDLGSQTDMDLQVEVTDTGLRVEHLEPQCLNSGQNSFSFPFDTEDVRNWVYHFENDNSIRYEVHSDAAGMLEVPVYESEVKDDDEAGELRRERTDRVLAFVDDLLWDRWIDLDGSDLLLMDPAGGPLEMTASHEWITPTVGAVSRPFRPARFQPTVAKLYADGRLALTWPTDVDKVEGIGLNRPLRDLLVIDLATYDTEEALVLYDTAYASMYEDLGSIDASTVDGPNEAPAARRDEADAFAATHVVVGKSANGPDKRIEELSRTDGEWGWTVPRVARAGDRILFYLLNPEGSFVATGRLVSDAAEGRSKEGDGKYVANVGEVRLLSCAVPRLEAVETVPGWGWPKQPHTATTVPAEHVNTLLNLLT